ncbi:hypothetical protein BKA65DRAFT_483605 [Rhexocercosporidium sp. MPI-PUGE-AT-0058]|nr:hypothetical protein BKA65DRAFT_483605 [Rhexocercosporidium sp. MPI-PUGE-AT-0058]
MLVPEIDEEMNIHGNEEQEEEVMVEETIEKAQGSIAESKNCQKPIETAPKLQESKRLGFNKCQRSKTPKTFCKVYEKLEREKRKRKIKTPSKKPSHFAQYSSLAKAKEQAASSPQKYAAEADDDEDGDEEPGEDEYEVEAILDERQYRVGKKTKDIVTYYLIKWVGHWPLSWEPIENVGRELIDEYERKKDMGLITVGVAGAAYDAAEAEEATAQAKAKAKAMEKGKKNKRGHGTFESDEDRARKETKGSALNYKKATQGQVIDDEDGSDYDSN